MEDSSSLVKKNDDGTYQINDIDTILIDETGMDAPMVSITMITYGHQDFIAQAIEGVLMQQTNFKFVLVIGEDKGIDQTRQIILSYQKKHPDKIILKLPEKNLGIMENSISNKLFCNGKYIAECEGDDYWTDPLKLQKQVDFLEKNDEYIIHSGVAKVCRKGEGNEEYVGFDETEKSFGIDDFYSCNDLITCTVMFRNCKIEIPYEFNKIIYGDWFLYVLLLKQTERKAYRSLDVFSVYRVHDGGLMSSLSTLDHLKEHIKQIIKIKKYVGYKKYSLLEVNRLNNYSLKSFEIELYAKEYLEALKTFLINLSCCSSRTPIRNYLSFFRYFLEH